MAPVASSLPAIFFTDEMPRPYPTVFIYAIAGAGKTNIIRTIAHLKPLVMATEDGNTKGMSTLSDLKLAALLIDNLDQLVAATAELSANARPGQLFYQGHGPFEALALDSLTGVGPMLEDAAKKLKGWDMIWDATANGGKDPRQAYPFIAEKGRQVVRRLMALPVPLVMLCREQMVTEGEGKNAIQYPAPELPGQKLPRELPGWPEATMRLKKINESRVLVTENEGNVVSRVRLGEGKRLPKYIKPDVGALLKVLTGDYSAMKDLLLDGGGSSASSIPSAPVTKTPQQLAAEARRAAAGSAAPAVQTA